MLSTQVFMIYIYGSIIDYTVELDDGPMFHFLHVFVGELAPYQPLRMSNTLFIEYFIVFVSKLKTVTGA
jgi:hypothetical protein